MAWCSSLGIQPAFQTSSTATIQTAVAAKTVDVVLWFCIWGEAANLRHLPEALCFLFHKCSETFAKFNSSQVSE